MKVRIQEKGNRPICILLPTKLIFNARFLSFGIRLANKYAPNQIPNVDPVILENLCNEICRIKSKYGHWELINVESANGDYVKVIL